MSGSPVSMAMEEMALDPQGDVVEMLLHHRLSDCRGAVDNETDTMLDAKAIMALATASYLANHCESVRSLRSCWSTMDPVTQSEFWKGVTSNLLSTPAAYQSVLDSLLSTGLDEPPTTLLATVSNVARLTLEELERGISFTELANAVSQSMEQLKHFMDQEMKTVAKARKLPEKKKSVKKPTKPVAKEEETVQPVIEADPAPMEESPECPPPSEEIDPFEEFQKTFGKADWKREEIMDPLALALKS